MDTNLDDSMNLEGSIGVDFDQSEDGTVINQGDITLSDSHGDGIPMDFEHIEEQPMLMDDTGNEEILDFMGDQISIQDYTVQDDHMTENITFESQVETLGTQHENKQTMQFNPTISVPASGVILEEVTTSSPHIVQVQSSGPQRCIVTKEAILKRRGPALKEVAIAPKPRLEDQMAMAPRLIKGPEWEPFVKKLTPTGNLKQFATIAPKPLKTLSVSKPVSLVKKVSIGGNVVNAKGSSVLKMASGGELDNSFATLQLVSAGGTQKLTRVAAGTGAGVRLESAQGQLISTETQSGSGQGTKPILAKVVLQGQSTNSDSNHSAVITKLVPSVSSSVTPQTKYVTVQPKTVPISIGNKQVLLASPTKQGVRFAAKKQQLIAIKSSTGLKIVPATSLNQSANTAKKVVISANPNQNIVLKTTTAPTTELITKVVSAGQRTQLHQINVPGKGVQYIRVVTNPTQGATAAKPAATNTASKTFVLTDKKGTVIQMCTGSQPPPLVTSGGSLNKVTSKPTQKLVRIAPVTSKPGQTAMLQQARSGQSLLAPISPQPQPLQEHREVRPHQPQQTHQSHQPEHPQRTARANDMPSLSMDEGPDFEQDVHDEEIVAEEIDSKAALRELIAKTLRDESEPTSMGEVEIEYNKQQTRHDDSAASGTDEQHPLIVIPYCKQETLLPDRVKHEPKQTSNILNVEVDFNNYEQPMSPGQYANSEPELVSTEIGGMRPRKACNCTKSQCLKLYCDCFASGEFCNGCNCHNCHNNLENEELRQKAIRGCLDRNPNAFRPKIGKAKIGGPEIIRRHNKGCNCKRSGCLKNYCECYEAKIACTAICKCVGCRNVEDTLERGRHPPRPPGHPATAHPLPHDAPSLTAKQPCSFMTQEVIEAVCQCLVAAAAESAAGGEAVREVLEEFARCLHDIISAAHHAPDSRHHVSHIFGQAEV